jgi:hypothetical protein
MAAAALAKRMGGQSAPSEPDYRYHRRFASFYRASKPSGPPSGASRIALA